MIFKEGDYVEHKLIPDVIWQVFEVTQIDTVTLNLWYEPPDYEPPASRRVLFLVLKSGDLVDQEDLQQPNAMELLALIHSRQG